MTNVTETFLPPINEYTQLLNRAWVNKWLTNRGGLVLELEDKITDKLGCNKGIAMNNGTIPLQIALKLLGNSSEVITTPFSYVATTSSIIWEQCKPVFVDIDPIYWCIDPDKIEEAITDKTKCILATHVFGNPCDVERIEAIAKKYNIFVVYDAAHAFGVEYKGESIFNYGDVSTCSFHATKIFHSGEGGMLFSKHPDIFEKAYNAHNFGHDGPSAFHGVGINGKMSELSAALGLAVLPYLDFIIESRKAIIDKYLELLNPALQTITLRQNSKWNYAYFPVVFDSETQLRDAVGKLNALDIFPRRYFYPSLNTLHFVDGEACPVSETIASRILCLPVYVGLNSQLIQQITSIISGKS